MNDYLKLKAELKHANPFRTKSNQFASKENYHHLVGEISQTTEQKPIVTAKDVSKKQLAVAGLSATGSIFKGLKDISDASSKILDGKGKSKKVFRKYPDIEDKELRQKLNRLKMESEYSDLVGDTKFIKSGSEKAKDVLQTIGSVANIGGAITAIVLAIIGVKSAGKKVVKGQG
jgi:hypothetical protein